MERCRTEMLRAKGLEQDRLIIDEDLLFAVHRVETNYYSPAKFNDKLLVTAEIVRSSKARLQFKQAVFRDINQLDLALSGGFVDDERIKNESFLLCDGIVSIAAVSAAQLRPKRISDDVYARFLNKYVSTP